MNETERRTLAKQIRPARKQRGWTQAELAKRAGVALGVVSAMERETATPQAATLTAVCRVLGIPTEGGDPSPAKCEDCASWSSDVKVALDILGLYLESFSPEDREGKIRALTSQVVNRSL